MSENELSYIIRGLIFKVYNAFGPGLYESVYVAALMYELKKNGLSAQHQAPVPVIYEGVQLDIGFRIDILVENKVILEIKSIENLGAVHHKQIITYLKLTDIKLGLLVNFNTDNIQSGIHRKVNGL